MDKNEAQDFLQGNGSDVSTNNAATPLLPANTSLSDLVSSASIGPLREAEASRKRDYIKSNQADGVPLDIETGISARDKLMLSFRRKKEDQTDYLKNRYGEDNVRTDSNGDFIVRTLGQDGKPVDLKVNESEMHSKDLLSLAGAVPEVVGGILAIKQGRGLPGIGKLGGVSGLQRDVLASALGGEAAGAVKDIGVGALDEKQVPDLSEIAKTRAEMGVGDVALGEATLGAGRLFNALRSPFDSSRGPVQRKMIEAQDYFKQNPKYNTDVPLTAGESTGAPILTRTEAYMEKLPGGGTPFKELKGKQEDALRSLQQQMMGKIPMADEPLGRNMIDALMQKVAPAEESVSQAAQQVGKVGTRNIENIIGQVTTPERQSFQEETGKVVRDAVTAKRDAVKSEADRLYEAVRNAPGGEGKVFDAEPLQERFKDILKRLPSPEASTQVPTGILGPSGTPITRTATGQEVLKEFVPPNVLSRLQRVADLKDAKFSLSDLQQMRREVYDDISKGEGVPGLGTHYLADIGKAITGAIDEGVSQLPSSDLKTALQSANQFYKEKVIPFNRVGLTELFRNPDEAGHISDSEVISRIFSGGKATERYNLMKEVLGEGSPELAKMKRSMLDTIIDSSRVDGENTIDPKKLVQNLTRLRVDAPSVAQDMLGGKINELFREAKFLEYKPGDKIDAQQLQNLLKSRSPTAKALQVLVDAERQRDSLYQNEIYKMLKSGELSKSGLNPVQFVNRFLDAAKPSDIKQVMYALRGNPELVQDIRAKTIEKIFRNAARAAQPEDVGKLLSDDPTRIVSGTSVFKQIENPLFRQKLKTIIGPEIFNDLEHYIHLQAGIQYKEQSFASAGGLAAGMQIANLTRHGPFRYLYEATKDWVVASLLTRPPLRQWLSSVPSTSEPGVISSLLTSPQFLRAVAQDFPGAKGSFIVNDIKNSVNRWNQQQGPQKQQQQQPNGFQDREKARQFLQF
jgi:hypothetical protein